ncbi:hypothetical protein GOP47_0017660 [Adiantum capillus-veneris]|uniref:Uncharacterized protein n=1 Tax=Adiantum capillus-veneris TaxID=13818 RepID=A0A9D4ZAT1_ADICA|nr:hypothetical protein GOP47_0017660 [Adiantum capillus-veneris]
MEQREIVHGQIPRKMPYSDTFKEDVYVPSPPRTQEQSEYSQQMQSISDMPKQGDFQHVQVLPQYATFTPIPQRQGQNRPLRSSQAHPSLSLSLERPDMYGSPYPQAYHEAPVRPPFGRAPFDAERPVARTDDVRPHGGAVLDLEQQPFQHSEQRSLGNYNVNTSNAQGEAHTNLESAGGFGVCQETYNNSHGMDACNVGGSSEQVSDGVHFQLVSATEHPSHGQIEHHQYYPPASTTHDAIVRDPQLFMTTLDNFLATLGTKLTIPKIEGLDLNLHAFYCEVTARGGLAQVIRLGQWKELSQVLGICKFSLNMPYVLRKHYSSLLFHYEQVYYFREEGQLVAPPVPLPAPSLVERVPEVESPYEAPNDVLCATKKRKRKLDPLQVFGVDPARSIGTKVTGAISGKTEEGYFVTVVVGTEKLSGVMYHVTSDGENNQFASVPSLLDGIGSEENIAGLEVQLYGKVRREPIRKRNPNGPKRTRTGYHIFFSEQREKLRQLYPETKGLGKKVIEMWGKLPDNEKAPYIARGNQEREKYLTEYNEKMKLQPPLTGQAVNVSCKEQSISEQDHGAYYVSHDYHVSLEPESELPIEHTQLSEADQVYHAYNPNGPDLHPSDVEIPGDNLISEQAYEMQEDEADYAQEAGSDEDEDDAEQEENYEGEEDEAVYPSETAYEEQDGGEYEESRKKYSTQEASNAFPLKEPVSMEPRTHGISSTPKQPYYGQAHGYTYTPSIPQPMVGSPGSVPLKSMGQSPYPMQENGKVVFPHIQPSHSEASGGPLMSQQQYFSPDQYAYATGKREMISMPPEQAAFHRLEDMPSYSAPFHQNQGLVSGYRMRQMTPEQAYQGSYAYPMHLPHAQMYARPPPMQGYPLRYPHSPYPMPWSESQAMPYGHAYAPQIHQPQASVPEASGAAPASQVYPVQDGGPTYPA